MASAAASGAATATAAITSAAARSSLDVLLALTFRPPYRQRGTAERGTVNPPGSTRNPNFDTLQLPDRSLGATVTGRIRLVRYSIQPRSFIARPAFQILVMWRIFPSSNSIT